MWSADFKANEEQLWKASCISGIYREGQTPGKENQGPTTQENIWSPALVHLEHGWDIFHEYIPLYGFKRTSFNSTDTRTYSSAVGRENTSFTLDKIDSLPGVTPPTGASTWCVWQKNKHLTNTTQSTPIMNKDLNLESVGYETKEQYW